MDYSIERDQFFSILDTALTTLDIDELLTVFVARIRHFLGAEKCTLFLIDKESRELYSKILSDDRLSEIRIALKEESLAGFSALRGRPVVVRDAHDADELRSIDRDLRFDGSWDNKSGFRTRSVLAVPVRAKGEIIGVLQALNKRGGFTGSDLKKTEEIAFVVGIAVQNALLYRRIEEEHQFTQHVMDMMEHGACVLDRHGAITFVNRAIEVMCGHRVSADEMRGRKFFEVFPQFLATPLTGAVERALGSGLETVTGLDAVRVRILPYHNPDGRVTRLILIFMAD